jgi:ribosomal protein S18 acetylase RimI-like enzyme
VDVEIELLADVDQATADAVARLVPQVSSRVVQVSPARVRSVAASPASCIVVARVGGKVVGSATLLILVTLVGSFGYLEEVVVDRRMRGHGVGRQLVSGVVDVARAKGLDFVELTSRSSREAANALYQSLSFDRRETNVYRLNLR